MLLSSIVTTSTPTEVLFARLQLSAQGARTFLIAPVRSSLGVADLVHQLAAVTAVAGYHSRVVDVSQTAAMQGDATPHASDAASPATEAASVASSVHHRALSPAESLSLERLREALQPTEGFTFVCGGGLLDSPSTILAVPSVDAVIVVAERGRTARADLERSRAEVERAGGRVVGAVLQR